jgi:hypothetical protein
MSKLILLLIGLLILAFIWLMWARVRLMHERAGIAQQKNILLKDFDKRRDMLPLLLEGFRIAKEATPEWSALLTARAEFRDVSQFEKETAFEAQLLQFMTQNPVRDIHFLEAKKDILELGKLIQKERELLQHKEELYLALARQFPYSVAAKIFAL